MLENAIKNFYQTLEDMECPTSCFLSSNLETFSYKPTLSYSRQEFINDIKKILENFPREKQIYYTSCFDFELVNNDFCCALNGIPSIENLSIEQDEVQIKIKEYVKKFLFENHVNVENNKSHEKFLNDIIKTFPQWVTLIGKIQHKTHSFCVDVHTLNVLQKVMIDENYKKLPQNDKRALQIAVLMHDITKKEGEIDKTHPYCSAEVTNSILSAFPISQEEKNRICLLIRNHDWLERYNKNQTTAKEFAEILKDGNNFKMLCILAKADLLSVQCGGKFYEKYASVLADGERVINELINGNEAA